MGKRKRRADQNKTPPPPSADLMRYGFYADTLCEKKSSNSVDNSSIKPPSSIMDIMNSSLKVSNVQHPHAHHHHNHSSAMLLRHPHYFYGRHYSRRNSANHAETSTSRGKGALHDEQSSSKLASLCKSDSGYHTDQRESEPVPWQWMPLHLMWGRWNVEYVRSG
ncbi:unnamed protein product [Ilex paraguariensis]|uniref:Uncharacterized protein n=1 Tax=Ilex paraguariensis TaxID=185542 RepID=A0ABC8RE49_9AQUA